jgi:uncharacterized membrane protein
MQLVQIIRAGFQSRRILIKKLLRAFGIGLLILSLRVILPVDKSMYFLLWNLFLAILPLLISIVIRNYSAHLKGIHLLIFLLLWLILFPNAPYMLTDYRHLQGSYGLALLIDFITIIYFAVLAFIIAVISLNDIRQVLKPFMSSFNLFFVVLAICLLSGFGVFIGRDMRFNSWDLLSRPFEVISLSFHGFLNFHSNYWTLLSSGLISLLLMVSVHVHARREGKSLVK